MPLHPMFLSLQRQCELPLVMNFGMAEGAPCDQVLICVIAGTAAQLYIVYL